MSNPSKDPIGEVGAQHMWETDRTGYYLCRVCGRTTMNIPPTPFGCPGARTSKQNIGDLFARYAQHDQDCAGRVSLFPPRGFSTRPCSCGMDAAIREIVAVEAVLRQVETTDDPVMVSSEYLHLASEQRDRARAALRLILPLAKGYSPPGQSDSAKRTCREWIQAAERILEGSPEESREMSGDAALRSIARLLPYAQQFEPADAAEIEAQQSVVLEAEKLLTGLIRPLEPKARQYICDCDPEQAKRCIDTDNRTGRPPNGCRRAEKATITPGPDLACEGFVPDPHSRFCDKCGYPQHEHRRQVNGN